MNMSTKTKKLLNVNHTMGCQWMASRCRRYKVEKKEKKENLFQFYLHFRLKHKMELRVFGSFVCLPLNKEKMRHERLSYFLIFVSQFRYSDGYCCQSPFCWWMVLNKRRIETNHNIVIIIECNEMRERVKQCHYLDSDFFLFSFYFRTCL